MKKINKKLGELLREAGLINDMQVQSALSYQAQWGGRVGSIIIKLGFVSEKEIISVIEKQYGLRCTSLDNIERPSDEVLNMVKVDSARKLGIIPLRLEGKTLVIAAADPTDLKTFDDLTFVLGVRIKPLLALESAIMNAIGLYYEGIMPPEKIIMDKVKLEEKIGEQVSTVLTTGRHSDDGGQPPKVNWTDVADRKPKPELSQKAVIEGLIDLLVSKGVFTRDELMNQLRSKK